MTNQRITQLFAELHPTIKTVVLEALNLEQQNITFKHVPRIKEQIDEIVTRAAKKEAASAANDQGKGRASE